MSARPRQLPTFRGRSLGVTALVGAQVLVGFIHVIFGFWLLSVAPDVYSVYTVVFSLFTLVFAVGLWLQRSWGWVGTVAVAAFVIVADSLVLLDLPSVPGIPKFAGYGEIPYSILVLTYLIQRHVLMRFGISHGV